MLNLINQPMFQHTAARRRLAGDTTHDQTVEMFQHTAARRRLDLHGVSTIDMHHVSTHSRPKAAGHRCVKRIDTREFQHTAARRRLALPICNAMVTLLFQHTAARRRLANRRFSKGGLYEFQHTAARRRLVFEIPKSNGEVEVSTHSRPKAAGQQSNTHGGCETGFNTQPPEGGWDLWHHRIISGVGVSTHSRPKAAGLA